MVKKYLKSFWSRNFKTQKTPEDSQTAQPRSLMPFDLGTLDNSSDIFRSILDNLPEGVVVADENGKFVLFNPVAEKIIGIGALNTTPDQWAKEYGLFRVDKKTPYAPKDLPLSRAIRGESVEGQEIFVKNPQIPEGVWIRVNGGPLRDEKGKIKGGVCVLQNISLQKNNEEERSQLEEQLRRTQNMEAIGNLAGGIAHDFNNMLAGILGNTDLLKLYSKAGGEVHQAVLAIERSAKKSAQLVKQLLEFARKEKKRNIRMDIHEVLSEVVELMGRTIDKNIRVVFCLKSEHFLMDGDPVQIRQVFLNLLVNAKDAMPQGGRLTIKSSFEKINAMHPVANAKMKEGDYIKISVVNTGENIPPEIIDRIFEPFFTTKEPGQGSGMGLAIVYGIVKNHGGFVNVLSEPDALTLFEVYLPVQDVAQFPEHPMPIDSAKDFIPEENSVRGNGYILVVDDEKIVREALVKLLRNLGYEVFSAADGQEALDIYRYRESQIDLVLIDLVMPELGGYECFLEMKKVNPNVRAILCSGYGVTSTVEKAFREGILHFIEKPYEISNLSQKIAHVLDDRIEIN